MLSNGMEMNILPNEEQVAAKAGEFLGGRLRDTHEPTLLLLSGGSSLNLLAHIILPSSCAELTVAVIDERFSMSKEENNFSRIRETMFYATAIARGASYLDTSVVTGETLQAFAARMDAGLKTWRHIHPNGKVYASIGIGSDAHVIGIMPYPKSSEEFNRLFENEQQWVVGYNATGKNQFPLRATVTLPFLRKEVDTAILYIVGESKKSAFKSILARKGTLYGTPGRIIHEMRDVHVFTDIPSDL